jgi:hypothetical protein
VRPNWRIVYLSCASGTEAVRPNEENSLVVRNAPGFYKNAMASGTCSTPTAFFQSPTRDRIANSLLNL